ncbi:Abi family protein [Gemella cuniculi]|uniref:Abi family protein n=1 Tax=Gemella cuniculi TaxID=150240 RepID=UPI0003F99E26|nr:Abi family protein [Gemella cuniculi]
MKPFKNLDEQLQILEDRNLKFENKEKAKRYLLEYNYYNVVNAYSKFFINTDTNTYYNNVYFENILEIHHFDKVIKTVIFEGIIEAERHFKSILAYCYCKHFKNDLYSYLDIKTYASKDIIKVSRQISNFANTLNKYKEKINNNSIKHYYKVHSVVPFWVLVDYLTLGEVTYFYSLLPDKIKNDVAKEMSKFVKDNLNTNSIKDVHFNIIQKGLENLTELRNITAHNNKMLGAKLRNDLPFYYNLHTPLDILNSDNRQSIYNTILYLKFFINYKQYAKVNNTIRKRMINLKIKIKNDSYTDKVFSSLGLPAELDKIVLK